MPSIHHTSWHFYSKYNFGTLNCVHQTNCEPAGSMQNSQILSQLLGPVSGFLSCSSQTTYWLKNMGGKTEISTMKKSALAIGELFLCVYFFKIRDSTAPPCTGKSIKKHTHFLFLLPFSSQTERSRICSMKTNTEKYRQQIWKRAILKSGGMASVSTYYLHNSHSIQIYWTSTTGAQKILHKSYCISFPH